MNNPTELWLLAANVTTNAESTASDIDFGSVVLSFLYFLAALLLIYLVLVLVNKWGKKNQNTEKAEQKEEIKEATKEQSDTDIDNTGENNV